MLSNSWCSRNVHVFSLQVDSDLNFAETTRLDMSKKLKEPLLVQTLSRWNNKLPKNCSILWNCIMTHLDDGNRLLYHGGMKGFTNHTLFRDFSLCTRKPTTLIMWFKKKDVGVEGWYFALKEKMLDYTGTLGNSINEINVNNRFHFLQVKVQLFPLFLFSSLYRGSNKKGL